VLLVISVTSSRGRSSGYYRSSPIEVKEVVL
jgi:hypothetical protein